MILGTVEHARLDPIGHFGRELYSNSSLFMFCNFTKKFRFVTFLSSPPTLLTWWCRSFSNPYDARLTVLWLWWKLNPNGYISLLWRSLLSILTMEITGVECQCEITENDDEITNYTYFRAYSSFRTEEWLYCLYGCHHRSARIIYEVLQYDFRESSVSFCYFGWWNHNLAMWDIMNKPS